MKKIIKIVKSWFQPEHTSVRRKIRNIVSLVLIISTFLITAISIYSTLPAFNNSLITVDKGEATALNVDFSKSKKYELKGTYRYFDKQWTVTDNLETDEFRYVTVPYISNIGTGSVNQNIAFYGSYQFTLSGLKIDDVLRISLYNGDISYRLFVDNELISYRGTLSKQVNQIVDQKVSKTNDFTVTKDSYVVTIEYASAFTNKLRVVPNIYNHKAVTSVGINTNRSVFFMFGGLLALFFCYFCINLLSKKILLSTNFSFLLAFLALALGAREPFFLWLDNLKIGFYIYDALYQLVVISTLILLTRTIEELANLEKTKKLYIYIVLGIAGVATLLGFIPPTIFLGRLFQSLLLLFLIAYFCSRLVKEVLTEKKYTFSGAIFATIILFYIYLNYHLYLGTVNSSYLHITEILLLAIVVFGNVIYSLKSKDIYAQIDQIVEIRKELTNTSQSLLLSQIKPHFIYNTLNAIKYLISTNPDKAEVAISQFSEYLTLNTKTFKERNLIPFDEELKYVKAYLTMEQLRFEERLEVIIEISNTKFFLPPITLEPLVENAVKHGASKRLTGGKVIIKTYEDAQNFYISVSDNGPGFDLEETFKENTKSIGIKNISRRLEIMLKATLVITSKIGEGTTSLITIPKKHSNVDLMFPKEIENE